MLVGFLLGGCASIIQGTNQDVPIDIPRGTRVTSASGIEIPVFSKYSLSDSGSFIRLDRDENYYVRFSYNGRQVTTAFEGHFQIGWLILDYMTFYGLLVDGISGAWHSFDGVAVRFPADTSVRPYVELFEPPRPKKIGVSILAGTGYALPFGDGYGFVPFFNTYSFGAGYHLTSRLMVMAELAGGSIVDILPRYTDYRTSASFSTYFAGARLRFQDDIYASAGGGPAHITSGDLEYFDETRPDLTTPPVNQIIGALYAALGVSGTHGYLELRHTFGLSDIPLSNGETGQFEITSINFGLNLHF